MRNSLAERVTRRLLWMSGAKPDYLLQAAPAPENAVGLFDAWASRLPFCPTGSGQAELFADDRIRWFVEAIGGVQGKSVLELGPLEGGHTYMLEQAGAQVTAVESNGHAWLKCLAVKENLGLRESRFLLGDFIKYLESTTERFDAIVACGVLYHLVDPHELFPLMRRVSDGQVMLWTMVWSADIEATHPRLWKNFSGERTVELPNGATVDLHRHEYRSSALSAGFWGGNKPYSEWMSQPALERAARAAGYKVADRAFVAPNSDTGPALALLLEPE